MFPKNYLNLPKKGFEVPLDKWLLNELKYLIDDAFSKKVFESLDVKDISVFDNWKKEFFAGKKITLGNYGLLSVMLNGQK